MLALWRLTLLCGLLISPSCCLLGLESLLNQKASIVTDTLQGVVQDLKNDPLVKQVENTLGDVKSHLLNVVKTVVSSLEKAVEAKLSDIVKLNVKPELSSDGKSLLFRLPVGATVALKVPLLPEILKLNAKVDIVLKVSLGSDGTTVVLGDCSSDLATLDISVLEGTGLKVSLFKNLTDILKKIIPAAFERQVCPVLGDLAKSLDANKIKEIISQLQTQVDVPKI